MTETEAETVDRNMKRNRDRDRNSCQREGQLTVNRDRGRDS